jgi:hypothetical protein
MGEESPTIYPGWDLAAPLLPARSRLYRLEPVGVGTPYVESLTGYVARLAEAHCVTASALFGWELIPRIEQKWLKKGQTNRAMVLASKFRAVARAMNGTGVTAEDWVRVVESATTRNDLRHLTMLAWRSVLSQRHLLRPMRAWCPACYEGWREQGQVVYEPLLWALDAVKSCPVHRLPLRTTCHHCDRQLFHLESHSRPGFCSACGGWLGARPSREETPGDEHRRQEWAVTAVGEMVAAAPRLARVPGKQVIARSTALCVERATAGGTILAFSRTHRLPKQTIGNWWRGESTPSLDSLLPFCFSAGVSLLDFLTGEVEAGTPCERPTLMEKETVQVQAETPPRRRRSIDRKRDARTLRAAFKENPPRSMVGIAMGIGRQPNTLKYQFPDLCEAIVARYTEHQRLSKVEQWEVARRALETALVDQSHQCVAEVARRVGWNCVRIRRRFPELCRLVTARHAEFKKEGRRKVEDFLKAALGEEPPPSMGAMVERSGYCETSLYFYFPSICRCIAARHREFRRQSFEKRRDTFAAEVRRIALELHSGGIYPSVKQVEALLSRGVSLRSSRLALEVLRRVRSELGLDSRTDYSTRF